MVLRERYILARALLVMVVWLGLGGVVASRGVALVVVVVIVDGRLVVLDV